MDEGGTRMMKRIGVVLLLVALGTSACVAARVGYSKLFTLPASGELTFRNAQKHQIWRPCVVAVMCPSAASRTVTVYRVHGEMEYPIASRAAVAQTYVYEFEANYWCGMSNGVKVVVNPACTGTVEVIYE